MIYTALFLTLVALRFALAQQPKLRDQVYPAVMVALFIFVAFRLDVGCDWNGYHRHFMIQLDLELGDALARREPLWWALVQMVGKIGLGYPWLNVASAALFFAGVRALARRQPDRLGVLILLFPVLIINMPMSGIRQAAAIGVLCFAFVAFQKGRTAHYAVLTLLAAGFHSSAAAFLLLVPLVGHGRPKARILAALLLAGPGLLLLASGESAQLAVARYVNTGVDAQGAIYRAGMLFLSAVLFLTLLRGPWQARYPADLRLVTLGAVMMLATVPLVFVSTVIADRLGYYLVPLQAVVFARIPYLALGRSSAVLAALPYLALLLVLAVWSIYSGHFHYCYLPYDTWLTGLPDLYQSPF